MGNIIKVCKCGKEFSVFSSTRRVKSCSRKCGQRFKTLGWKSNITQTCKCGKEFRVYPFQVGVAKYCSRGCANKYGRGRVPGYKCPNGSLAKMGIKNPNFGKIKENPSYEALHSYIHKRLDPGKPKVCQHCNQEKKLQLANKSHDYKRELDDWLWLCKKCHFKYDGGEKYLALRRVPGKRFEKKCLNCETIIKDITPGALERTKYCSRRCLMLYMRKNKLINHI